MRAIETVARSGTKTPDVGGRATTCEVGDAILGAIGGD
jgi:isocitrate/isopropylmalate dehydrogenase